MPGSWVHRPWAGVRWGRSLRGMPHFHDVIDDLRKPTHDLREAIPEVWAGFAAMHKPAVADGVLTASVKELIALAIAVHAECDGCIAYHARAAALRGATQEEVAEALGVALLMSGGPASVYAPRALAAFQEFAQ
jgi:AhpD family alkylhydroperoxidase